jgi:hypothetical protein
MYDSFEVDRQRLGPEQLIDIRYEDLIADPQKIVGRIYEQLHLGDSQAVLERLAVHLASHKDYQPNQHQVDEEIERVVQRDWVDYARRYGYLEPA